MREFRQYYKRRIPFMGLFLSLAFGASAFMADGLLEDAPWLFWGMLGIAGIGALGAVGQLLRPPLVLAADSRGITLGFTQRWLNINLSPAYCSVKRQSALSQPVPWNKIRSIGIDEVVYKVDRIKKREPALRIEFDESVDVSSVGDMLAIQSGTEAYFATCALGKSGWKEPSGRAKSNIVVIGEQHFDATVHHVCDRLQKMAEEAAEVPG